MDKFELLCLLEAISNYAYDIHYTANGRFFFSDHLFSERLSDVDVKDDFIETFYLGKSQEAPASADIARKVADLTPEITENEQDNFKRLRNMIIRALMGIQAYDGTKGEDDLLGSVAHILQRHNGLLYRQLTYTPEEIRNDDDDWRDIVDEEDTTQTLENEKWITVHPNKENPDDYRRLKVEDGETSKEAVERKFGKDDKKADKDKKEPEKEEKGDNKGDKKQKINPHVAKYIEARQKRIKAMRKMSEFDDEIKKKTEEKREKSSEYRSLTYKIEHPSDYKIEELSALYKARRELDDEIRKEVRESIPEYNEAYKEVNNLDKYTESSEEFYAGIKEIQSGIKERLSEVSKENEEIYQKIVSLGDDISSLEKEHKEAHEKWSDLYIQEVRSGKTLAEINAATEEYHERSVNANKKLKEARERIAKEVGKILREEDGVEIKFEKSPIKDLADRMNEVFGGVLPKYMEPDQLSKVSTIRGRAHYSGNTLSLSKTTDVQTAIHEYMHFIEDKNPQMMANSIAFLRYRTEGEKVKSLKALTGISYGAKEKARPDKFFNAYCGKTYSLLGDKDEPYLDATATEIMSMGVEELYKDPVAFAKNDREYFDFVIANLKGRL